MNEPIFRPDGTTLAESEAQAAHDRAAAGAPVFHKVNGRRVMLSTTEAEAVRAEWDANTSARESVQDQGLPVTRTELDALKARLDKLDGGVI